MPLFAPEVVGPISVCNKAVRIRGNVSGAVVRVLVDGAEVASHTSNTFDDIYDVGIPLPANARVTAKQSLDGDTSDASLIVVVQAAPDEVTALTVHTTLYECGRAVRVSGGVPGATVEVRVGSQLAGKGTVVDGRGVIKYEPVAGATGHLSLTHVTCTGVTATQQTPVAIPQPSPLHRPVIDGPLIDCQTTLTVGGVVDGAFVEMRRNGDPEATFVFSTPKEWRSVKVLNKGEVIEVRQGFRCKSGGAGLESFSKWAKARVKGHDALGRPLISTIPCPGTTFVKVSNLIPGARVVLMLGTEELGQTDAPASTCIFPTPPLSEGSEVRAFMRLCGHDGPAGKASVPTAPQTPKDVLVSDLYACAAYVYVNLLFGPVYDYLVYLENQDGQQISGYHLINDGLVPVSPALVGGQKVTLRVQACGEWLSFGPWEVSAGTAPPPKINEPAKSGDKYVDVVSLHAGALISVFVNGDWWASAISLGNLSPTLIILPGELETGDHVYATQTLCGKTSKPSKTVTVKKAKPERAVLISPSDGATGVSAQPVFKWSDPGVQQENAAESFRLIVKRAGVVKIDVATQATEYASAAVLEYATDYTWTVDAINSTGTTITPSFGFRTQNAPEPPDPNEGGLRFDPPIRSDLATGFPRDVDFGIFIPVRNDGDEPSPSYKVIFTMSYQNEVVLTLTNDEPALAAGSTVNSIFLVNIGEHSTVRLEMYLFIAGEQVDYTFRDV